VRLTRKHFKEAGWSRTKPIEQRPPTRAAANDQQAGSKSTKQLYRLPSQDL
jgi:hypothetical protein